MMTVRLIVSAAHGRQVPAATIGIVTSLDLHERSQGC